MSTTARRLRLLAAALLFLLLAAPAPHAVPAAHEAHEAEVVSTPAAPALEDPSGAVLADLKAMRDSLDAIAVKLDTLAARIQPPR